MCGLVAVFSQGPLSCERLKQCERALELIRHRGPDHQQVMRFDRAVLAHARLSIVDLSEQAHQPFQSRDGRWILVWNGEIYNHVELRKELEACGVHLEGHSDTEVLLYAFLEWGEACLSKLNGMWGMAIYDQQRHELFLARDRFGIKPLYWSRNGGEVFVASELKAFLPFNLARRVEWARMTPLPIREDLTQPREETIFKDVKSVPPGTFLRITGLQDSGPHRFWCLEDEKIEIPTHFEDRSEKLRALLTDAIRVRTSNDVPTAIALSGGIDSSSIYGACQSMQGQGWTPTTSTTGTRKKLQAFTAEYPGEECDEAEYALACGAHWQDPAGITCVHPRVDDFPRLLKELVWHQEVPIWSPAAAGYHAFYREVSEAGYRVILEGHGADEILGGYPDLVEAAYRAYFNEGRLLNSWSALRCSIGLKRPEIAESPWRLTRFGLRHAKKKIKKKLRSRMRHTPMTPSCDDADRETLLSESVGPWEPVATNEGASLSAVLKHAFTEHPHPMFLRVFDRATMAHGLESTAPFLDHRLVRYLFSLPDSDKVLDHSKQILRHAAKDWLPHQVQQRRRKQGFSAPLQQWFNQPGMREYLEDSFRSAQAIHSEGIDAKHTISFLEGKRGQPLDNADIGTLWPALNLTLWESQFSGHGTQSKSEHV